MTPHRCTLWNNITIEQGTKADYETLAPFHYRAHRPIAVTRIWTARYTPPSHHSLLIPHHSLVAAVLVETRPILNCALRNIATHNRCTRLGKREGALLLNKEMTSIARVIVHPVFRSLGVAS